MIRKRNTGQNLFSLAFHALDHFTVGSLIPPPLFGVLRGAQVLEVPNKSRAYALGLEAGDVIVGLDSAKILTLEDLLRQANRAGMQYRLVIVRGGIPAWLRVIR